MSILTRHWRPVAVTCLLSLPLSAWGYPDESTFLELRTGNTLIGSNVDADQDDELSTYSFAYGVQSRHLSFSFEHTRTRDSVRYHTNAVMAQLEGDNELDGFGFFARLGLINVSVGGRLDEDTDDGLGLALGAGARYQFASGHRLFLDSTIQNSDLVNVSLGFRLPL